MGAFGPHDGWVSEMAANKTFASMKDLLPSVLAKLASENGRVNGIQPLWEEIAGASIARSAVPHSLVGGVLTFKVPNARWKTELDPRAAELLERLNARLGARPVRSLVFVVGA